MGIHLIRKYRNRRPTRAEKIAELWDQAWQLQVERYHLIMTLDRDDPMNRQILDRFTEMENELRRQIERLK